MKIALTVGDPTSIGPEVASEALSKVLPHHPKIEFHVFAPRNSLKLGPLKQSPTYFHDETSAKWISGRPSSLSARSALVNLKRATLFCLENSCPLVTGPVDKSICNRVDHHFKGQTEYLRDLCQTRATTMMLSDGELQVALVTTHLALSDVSKRLSKEAIVQTAKHLHSFLKFRYAKPRLAILGLNPHASDHGLFGNEEEKVILPAMKELKNLGMSVEGPFSSDSFFAKPMSFSGVVAMYHDQGLIPLKMKSFYDAVNITLGLPFLRVSVDHGTAFDIAGQGVAISLSYERALKEAIHRIENTSLHRSTRRKRA